MYLRDLYTCQYCETELIRANLTVDHVLPVSKGGTLEWNNCVTACMPCNTAKGDKQLMKPRIAPYTPTYFELAKKRMQMPLQVKHPSWEPWLKV
jgi:5-methylcytosine-specific restriction endonuclease McrA